MKSRSEIEKDLATLDRCYCGNVNPDGEDGVVDYILKVQDEALCEGYTSEREDYQDIWKKQEKEIAELKHIKDLYHELCEEWRDEKCEDDCNSHGHSKDCANVNLGVAKRNLHKQIQELKEQIESLKCCGNCKYKDYTKDSYESFICSHHLVSSNSSCLRHIKSGSIYVHWEFYK